MSRHTGFAHLPLHASKAPAWLFGRMTRLARAISNHIVADHGSDEMLRRLADPFWFQAFGCVLGGGPPSADRWTALARRGRQRPRLGFESHVDRSEKVQALERLATFARAAEPVTTPPDSR